MTGPDLRWRALNNPGQGLLNTLSKTIARIEETLPHKIPDIRSAPHVAMASDYGGDHPAARYRALSFVLADGSGIGPWQRMVRDIRSQMLRPTTEMSFVERKEGARSRAMPHWLLAANTIPGVSMTILIDRDLDRVTLGPPQSRTIEQTGRSEWRLWTQPVFERMMRILFYGLTLVRGLAREPQSVLWAMDDDAIVPNRKVAPFFREALVASARQQFQYWAPIDFTVTSDDQEGDFRRRDICSIPDIVAGTLGAAYTEVEVPGLTGSAEEIFGFGEQVPPELAKIITWVTDDRWALKRLLFLVHRDKEGRFWTKHLLLHGPWSVDRPLPQPLPVGGRILESIQIMPLANGVPVLLVRADSRWQVLDADEQPLTDSTNRDEAMRLALLAWRERQPKGR
jgi:hypothetical protein